MGHPRPLFVYLRSFQTNKTIFTTYKYEKCPSSMRCWNSNPQPSPPITSRSRFLSPSPTLMAFTGVTNAHGPSPQPTECRSPTFSLDHGCRLISSRHCTHSLARVRTNCVFGVDVVPIMYAPRSTLKRETASVKRSRGCRREREREKEKNCAYVRERTYEREIENVGVCV